ncbi:MAG: hypothetical protein RJA10_481 [Pseudomonadota bacterium]|jgi:hypothetical protein
MNAAAIERFLARLYTDEALRQAFVERPDEVMQAAGLDEPTQRALRVIDRPGLLLASHSLSAKRHAHPRSPARRQGAARAGAWWRAPALALVAVLALLALVGCGGDAGDSGDPVPVANAAPGAPSASAPDRRQVLAAAGAAAAPVTVDALFDWAELVYAPLFPAGAGGAARPQTVSLQAGGQSYQVRYYPETFNYVGVRDDGTVWGYGPFTGQVLSGFGAMADFTCLVSAGACPPAAPTTCETTLSTGFSGDLNAVYTADAGGDGADGGADGGSAGVGGSEGKVLGGRLRVIRLADGAVLGQGLTDPERGLTTLRWCRKDLPVMLELQGAPGARYFEEAVNDFVDFPLGQRLRALVDRFDENVGVSALTEAAYVYALNQFGPRAAAVAAGSLPLQTDGVPLGLTAAQVRQANAAVLAEVNRPFTDRLQQPSMKALGTPIDQRSGANALPNNRYGRLAALQGGFAKVAQGYRGAGGTPALAFSRQFADDLSDGRLDGLTKAGQPVAALGEAAYKSTEASVEWTIGQGQIGALFGQTTTLKNAEPYIDSRPAYQAFSVDCRDGFDGPRLANHYLTSAGVLVLEEISAAPSPCYSGSPSQQRTVRPDFFRGVKRLFGSSLADRLYALTTAGDLYGWGWNACGRLGNGETADTFTAQPQRIQGLGRVVKAQTNGNGTSLALNAAGEVYAWGLDNLGSLGLGSLAGEAVCEGRTLDAVRPPYARHPMVTRPRRIAGLSGIVDIAMHDLAATAVAQDGSVYTWGAVRSASGAYQAQRTPLKVASVGRAVKVTAVSNLTSILTANGEVHALWTIDQDLFVDGPAAGSAQPRRFTNVSDVVDLVAEPGLGTLALRRDGQVYVWGEFCCTASGVPVIQRATLGSAFPLLVGQKPTAGRLPRIVRVMSIGRIPVAVGADGKLYAFSPGWDGTAVGWYDADYVLNGPVLP